MITNDRLEILERMRLSMKRTYLHDNITNLKATKLRVFVHTCDIQPFFVLCWTVFGHTIHSIFELQPNRPVAVIVFHEEQIEPVIGFRSQWHFLFFLLTHE